MHMRLVFQADAVDLAHAVVAVRMRVNQRRMRWQLSICFSLLYDTGLNLYCYLGAVPNGLVRPRQVAEHVAAAERVYTGRMRKGRAVALEHLRPRIEQYFTPYVRHRKFPVGRPDNAVHILDSGRQ